MPGMVLEALRVRSQNLPLLPTPRGGAYSVGINPVNQLCACTKSLQSCPGLCSPMDCYAPGSSSPWDSPGKNTGNGLPFPSPGDLPDPGIKRRSPALQADSLPSEP